MIKAIVFFVCMSFVGMLAFSAEEKLVEEQIPLNISTIGKSNESSSSTAKAMASGVVVVIILSVSYFLVRKYKTSNSINKSQMQIKILTQHYLGPKKSLAIVHVAGESILIGVTDQNISMIKSLSLIDDEVPAELPNTFGQSLSSTNSKSTAFAATTADADMLDEEFSFTNVTDTVAKKIKSMRSLS